MSDNTNDKEYTSIHESDIDNMCIVKNNQNEKNKKNKGIKRRPTRIKQVQNKLQI